MFKNLSGLLLCLALVSTSSNAWGAKSKKKRSKRKKSNISKRLKKINKKQIKKNWSLNSSISLTTDTKKTSDKEKSYSSTAGVNYLYKFSNGVALKKGMSFSKNLTGDKEGQLNDGAISISRKLYEITSNSILTGSFSQKIPYNQENRNKTYFITASTASIGLINKLRPIGLPNTSLSFGVSGTRKFHEFKENAAGSFNIKNITTIGTGLAHSLNDKVGLGADFTHITLKDFNNVTRPSIYEFSQYISVSLPQATSLTVGHTTGGNTYDKYTNTDLDIEVYDADISTFFISLGHSY